MGVDDPSSYDVLLSDLQAILNQPTAVTASAIREFEFALWFKLGETATAPRFLGSIDAAVLAIQRVLPGWWWSCGECWISSDASIAHRASMAPHGLSDDEYLNRLPDRRFDQGFKNDLRKSTVPIALVLTMLEAKVARDKAVTNGSDPALG